MIIFKEKFALLLFLVVITAGYVFPICERKIHRKNIVYILDILLTGNMLHSVIVMIIFIVKPISELKSNKITTTRPSSFTGKR